MNGSGGSARIGYLDGLRTVSVALVILSHLSLNTWIAAFYDAHYLRFIGNAGYQGVLIFFFISGYVISLSSLGEIERRGRFSVSGFYIRRVFRIIPPLSFYLVACLGLAVAGLIDLPRSDLARAFLYSCNVERILPECGWYMGHTWSLAFEEQFYLCFPLVFSFIVLRRRVPGWFVVPLFVAVIPFVFPVHWIGRTGFVTVYCLFGLGFLYATRQGRFPDIPKPLSLLLLFASALVTFFPIDAITSSFAAAKYHQLVFIVSVPALVISAGVPGTLFHRFCSLGIMARIGRATYSIYLWQEVFTGQAFADHSPFRQIVCVVLSIVFCVAMYETVESRLIRYGRALASRRLGPLAERAE